MKHLQVLKLDHQGVERWRYPARVLSETPHGLLMEAFFNHPDVPFHGIVLAQGDRFLEAYFWRRWYNIFQVHDRTSGTLKGWYCNVVTPSVLQDGVLSCRDLALDLLVYPNGHSLVLDEDEFAALELPEEEARPARQALAELQAVFQANWPFELSSWMASQAGIG